MVPSCDPDRQLNRGEVRRCGGHGADSSMPDSSNHGSGEVLNIARSPVVLSDAERNAGGGDVVVKTFGDAAGLTTSDNKGLRFGADIFSSITTIQIVFWGKEWTRPVPPPPVS